MRNNFWWLEVSTDWQVGIAVVVAEVYRASALAVWGSRHFAADAADMAMH